MVMPRAGFVGAWSRRLWSALVVLAICPGVAECQWFRGWAGTSVQSVELRPLGLDTIPRVDVLTDVAGRFFYEGQEVTCTLADQCTGYLALGKERTTLLSQDLGGTLWGLGVQGLSFTTLVRARASFGGQFVWPRSDDDFDALVAYAELDRGRARVRAGRQEVRSGLGFPAFDGVSAAYRLGTHRVEVYGGRSLARGLREPARDALSGLDDFFVDKGVVLIGLGATTRAFNSTLTTRYHREIASDRSGLVSERASLDLSTSLDRARVIASIDYDFSFKRVGKSELTVSAPLHEARWLVELSGRRYVPYFDLSTIWGFFEPVSYTEILARTAWSPFTELGVWISGGRRSYGDTETAVVIQPLSDTGWRADAGARWQVSPQWTLDGRYELEWGSGGFLNAIDAGTRYMPSERVGASLTLMSFQQVEEYRLGDGRAFGASASIDYELSPRTSVLGGLSLLRHRDGGNVFTSPWNQTRAWTSVRVELGGDPGLSAREAGR